MKKYQIGNSSPFILNENFIFDKNNIKDEELIYSLELLGFKQGDNISKLFEEILDKAVERGELKYVD